MKKIEAIIRKSKYSEVKDALHGVGVNFFTYWDVTGKGNEKEVAFDTSFVASCDELRNELEPFTEFAPREFWVLR